ncbi:hypothetical protein ABTX77_26730 [Streptomyces sp. NPDC097704]|uniref:hypothetical protein n=1 Tax=Streptomyces sp. NPDC097704 TaxID=3157101 RepID=UPI00331E3B17
MPVDGDEYVKDFRGTVERAGEMGRCDRRLVVRMVKPLGLGESEPLHDVGERPAEVALLTVPASGKEKPYGRVAATASPMPANASDVAAHRSMYTLPGVSS